MTKTTMIFILDKVYYDGDGDDTDNDVMHNVIGTIFKATLLC